MDDQNQSTLPTALRYLAQWQGPPTSHRMIEAADEIERLRAALMEIVSATDVGAYFTARRAAGVAIGMSPKP